MSNPKRPALLLYTGDWKKDPAVSACSPATRAVWIDWLCAMHDADESGRLVGDLPALARIGRCTVAEARAAVTELRVTRTAEIRERNGRVTVVNRRMRRDYDRRKANAQRQKQHRGRDRNADVTPEYGPTSTSPSSSSSSSSSTRNGTCDKCDRGAIKDHKGKILRCCNCDAGRARALRFAREKQLEEESEARKAEDAKRGRRATGPTPLTKSIDKAARKTRPQEG